MMDVVTWQWVILVTISVTMFLVSPWAKTATDFFKGSAEDKPTSTLFLTSSLVISWIFAKSITNAADLGSKYGMVGSISYAAYYLSFLVAGVVIYRMRTKGHFQSIHQFLAERYGRGAIILFTILISIRLLNEIWSNTMVIGSYFGVQGSISYYAAIAVFTTLTLAYTLKGGMRSSITTDVIQMLLFVVLLVFILVKILPATEGGAVTLMQTGTWDAGHGINLLFVALIQVMSYPFHDPVMTDRGFIADARQTLQAFVWAGLVGFVCIILFSWVGIFGAVEQLSSPVVMMVSKFFGVGFLLVINTIMLTSAASTIDSTMTSTTKLVEIDILHHTKTTISRARWTMVLITILGTIPVFFNPDILSATTISGTIVLGLAPIFLFWHIAAPKISFYGSVGSGIFFGIMMVVAPLPPRLTILEGPYADLLTINICGTIVSFALFFIPIIYHHLWPNTQKN